MIDINDGNDEFGDDAIAALAVLNRPVLIFDVSDSLAQITYIEFGVS